MIHDMCRFMEKHENNGVAVSSFNRYIQRRASHIVVTTFLCCEPLRRSLAEDRSSECDVEQLVGIPRVYRRSERRARHTGIEKAYAPQPLSENALMQWEEGSERRRQLVLFN